MVGNKASMGNQVGHGFVMKMLRTCNEVLHSTLISHEFFSTKSEIRELNALEKFGLRHMIFRKLSRTSQITLGLV